MAEKKGFFYGWLILLTCILIMGLGYAPLVSCASLFTKPVTEDLGFTRSAYALVSTIAALMMAFMSPFIGKIMSKPYMHKALVVCMLGNCLAYCCYSFASTLPLSWTPDMPRPCLLYTSPSPRDPKTSRMPSSA